MYVCVYCSYIILYDMLLYDLLLYYMILYCILFYIIYVINLYYLFFIYFIKKKVCCFFDPVLPQIVRVSISCTFVYTNYFIPICN